MAGPAPQNCPPRWLNSYGVHLPDCSRFIRCDCHLQIYCGCQWENVPRSHAVSHRWINQRNICRRPSYYWEKAEQTTAYERQCWLMIASGYLRLHEELRQKKQSAESTGNTGATHRKKRPKEASYNRTAMKFFRGLLSIFRSRSSVTVLLPNSRPHRSSLRAKQLRRNFPLIWRF